MSCLNKVTVLFNKYRNIVRNESLILSRSTGSEIQSDTVSREWTNVMKISLIQLVGIGWILGNVFQSIQRGYDLDAIAGSVIAFLMIIDSVLNNRKGNNHEQD